MGLCAAMRVGPGRGLPVPSKRLRLLLLVIMGAVIRRRGARVVRVLVDCRLIVMTKREKKRKKRERNL